MTGNPIIQREFIGTLRSPRALAVQVLLVAALATLVLVRWPSEGAVDLSGLQAQQVLRVFGYGLMAVLILLAPVFPATSIVKERIQGTLALLLNSPINPWSIVWGKLTGVVGFVAILLALSLPAAAAVYAMGGINLVDQLLLIYVVLFVLAVQYATLGLLVSSFARTIDGSLRTTYGLILVMAVLVLGPYRFVEGQIWADPLMVAVFDWLSCLSPIRAVAYIVGDEAMGGGGQMTAGNPALKFTALALVSSAVFATWTAARMNQRLFDTPRDQGRVTDEQSKRVQAYRRVMYLWFFDPQRRGELIGLRPVHIALAAAVCAVATAATVFYFSQFELAGDPFQTLPILLVGAVPAFIALVAGAGAIWMLIAGVPTAVKEQKCSRFGRSHWMMRLIGACLIVSLGLMLLASLQSTAMDLGRLGGIMVLLQVALIVLITPALAGGLISGERESRGWQLLQMTPMSPLSIVAGKLMSVAVTLALILAATLPGYAVLVAIAPAQQPVVVDVLITLVLTAVTALLATAAVSSLFKNTAAATATAYAILLTLCAATLLIWLAQDAPFTHDTVEAVLTVNPLAAAMSLIGTPGFARYELVPTNWWFLGGLCVVSLVTLVVQTWRLTRPR